MSMTFFGSWSLAVLSSSAVFQERARIQGSQASDGIIPGTPGQAVARIDGPAWLVALEWSSDGGVHWHPSRIRRLPSVTPQEGLIITLGADDNTPEAGDGDFNDLIVHLVYLNRDINPAPPAQPPYSFTVPPEVFRPPHPGGHGTSPYCGCHCCCGQRTPKRAGRCR